MSDSEKESSTEEVQNSGDEFDLLEKDESEDSLLDSDIPGDTDEVEGYSFAHFADAMQKILNVHLSSKISTPVLCKRKLKYSELNEMKAKDKLARQEREEKKARKEVGHVAPETLNDEIDQLLRRIATKGAVTLFTAISTYQRKRKAEKKADLKKKKKHQFSMAEVLNDVTKNESVPEKNYNNEENEVQLNAEDNQNHNKAKWAALDENLLANPKLKDWDQEEESDDHWSDDD